MENRTSFALLIALCATSGATAAEDDSNFLGLELDGSLGEGLHKRVQLIASFPSLMCFYSFGQAAELYLETGARSAWALDSGSGSGSSFR